MLVGLEVDGQRMTFPMLSLHLVGGIAAGALYFGSLWWNATLFGGAGRVQTLIVSMAVRFVALGAILMAVSLEGAIPLLATASGVLIARTAVLYWVRLASP